MRSHPIAAIAIAYLVSVILYTVAGFFPGLQFWGIGVFRYYSPIVPPGVGGLMIGAMLVVSPWRTTPDEPTDDGERIFWVIAGIVTAAVGIAFILARTTTHFLGDGYTLLSTLAADKPLIKEREIGEAMTHIWVKQLIGGSGEHAALLSFRVISIASGIVATIGTLLFSHALFKDWRDGSMFAAGLLTGGYALLFFGYVENYSLFVVAVIAFTGIGILAAEGHLKRWYILIPLVAAILCHTLGLILLPAAIYILLARTGIGRALADARTSTWAVIILLLGIAGGIGLYYLISANYFIRFALLPIVHDRFTVDNYTLFAWRHLTDFVNLLFLLLPGVLVLGAAAIVSFERSQTGPRTVTFLSIAAGCTLGAVFVFDPKLGMYRDWDLFSFAAVPPAALGYLVLLRGRLAGPRARRVALLSVLLATMVLVGRLAVINEPPRAIAAFNECIERDHGRSRTARRILIDYYVAAGDTAQADRERRVWHEQYPIRQVYDSAHQMVLAGDCRNAARILRRVVQEYPNYAGAWSNLCSCFSREYANDSADYYCRVALGMNPYDVAVLNNYGLVLFRRGERDRAHSYFVTAYESGQEHTQAAYNLARAELDLGDREAYERLLTESATEPNAPAGPAYELTRYYVAQHRLKEAAQALELAVVHGLDTARVRTVFERVPELIPEARRYRDLNGIIGDSIPRP